MVTPCASPRVQGPEGALVHKSTTKLGSRHRGLRSKDSCKRVEPEGGGFVSLRCREHFRDGDNLAISPLRNALARGDQHHG